MVNRNSVAIASGFAVMGILVAYPGLIVQKASIVFGFTVLQKAALLGFQFWGCCGGIFVGMLIAGIVGKKRFLYIGAILIAAGFALGIIANSFLLLALSLLVAGCGLGFYESGYNAMCLDYVAIAYPSAKAQSTSLFHFFFGLGAIVSPILIEAINMALPLWNAAFIAFLPVPLVCSLLLFRMDTVSLSENTRAKISFDAPTLLVIALFALASALYVGAETTVYGWLPVYWVAIAEESSILPGFAVSVFWITFSLGRLVGGPLVSKIGDERYVISVIVAALVLALAWAYGGHNPPVVLFCVAMAGLLLSCIFPTLLVAFDRALPGVSATVSGLFLFFGTLSAAVFPSISGSVFVRSGTRALPVFWFAVLLLFLFVCCGAFFASARNRIRA